ncbi:unnamed protein product [Parnassius apollo]|uniref:(apollo) hypothetical protein n=1 Tax=Parnassius apollo TaxID=110799 RepID=A0A8S3W5R4_PARAO|nr:unnamed protein product [Parnassius apollo]
MNEWRQNEYSKGDCKKSYKLLANSIVHLLNPNAILVELCRQRVSLLELDEKKFLEEAKNFDSQKFKEAVKGHKGLTSGMLHAMLLKTYADIAKELGVAPGGEFRRAYQEASL